jgi:hypothetical protein
MSSPNPTSPVPQAAQPLVIDQAALMQIITTIQQAQQKQTHPTPAKPRVGGVNTMGAWTGGGA